MMLMIKTFTRACIRTYTDNGQEIAYVEWIDERGASGRTEGTRYSAHMQSLLRQANLRGIKTEREVW